MMLRQFSRLSTTTLVLGAGLALSGCLGPTYGTGQSQGEQLFNDLDGMLTLGSSNKQNIDYTPRAELVKPKQIGALPTPQEKVDAARDPNWPESPEQRSARIKAAADAEADGRDGAIPASTMLADREGIDPDVVAANTRGSAGAGDNGRGSTTLSAGEMKDGGAAFRERLKETKQGSPTQRKYLSEPPIAYRQPSGAAPVGDPGLDEAVKEARYKKDEGFGSKIRSLLPF
ncbi:hypothetical protein ASG43_04585 [Aureimonas sp. Leaf454]|uniref:hypothetical protein n=1 Tax=Aureimonas sp. Leaf454 TaxID=1736381 RepID=UPI0006FC0CFF|nr:hypothetical protein [Aureimonas sp. Leaf454]KQT54831.1 hypothetical protein ASG43_04585 [Aureimonas sp. Leaf454]